MFDYARTWLALRTDKRGVTAMEYGLIAAFIAVVIITAVGHSAIGIKAAIREHPGQLSLAPRLGWLHCVSKKRRWLEVSRRRGSLGLCSVTGMASTVLALPRPAVTCRSAASTDNSIVQNARSPVATEVTAIRGRSLLRPSSPMPWLATHCD